MTDSADTADTADARATAINALNPAILPATPQLCLPLLRPPYPISPHRRGPKPENVHYHKLGIPNRRTASGHRYYIPNTVRSKSPNVRKRAARIKPLPSTPAAAELADLIARVNQAIIHGMLTKYGVTKQKQKCGRKAVYFPGLPMAETAALVNLKPESLRNALKGCRLMGPRTLKGLADLAGLRMEQLMRLSELRELVDKDIQDIWERRSLLIREGLKNRVLTAGMRGQPGWLANPTLNPTLRYKAELERMGRLQGETGADAEAETE